MKTTNINGIVVTIESPTYGEVSLWRNDTEYTRNLKSFIRDGNVMDENDNILKVLDSVVEQVESYAKSVGFKAE